jgi:DNA-binding protein H-NS
MAGRAGAAGKARTVAQLERQLNLVKQAANARKSRAAQTAADRAAAQREQQRIKELQAAIERAKRS